MCFQSFQNFVSCHVSEVSSFVAHVFAGVQEIICKLCLQSELLIVPLFCPLTIQLDDGILFYPFYPVQHLKARMIDYSIYCFM